MNVSIQFVKLSTRAHFHDETADKVTYGTHSAGNITSQYFVIITLFSERSTRDITEFQIISARPVRHTGRLLGTNKGVFGKKYEIACSDGRLQLSAEELALRVQKAGNH